MVHHQPFNNTPLYPLDHGAGYSHVRPSRQTQERDPDYVLGGHYDRCTRDDLQRPGGRGGDTLLQVQGAGRDKVS